MKTINLALLLLVLLLGGCELEKIKTSGSLSISFQSDQPASGGGRAKQLTPSFVLISVETGDGQAIFTDKKIPLYLFGSGYITESLELYSGPYNLTKFMVLDENNSIIYATPVTGSALASLVDHPLPISFEIADGQSTELVPEVVQITSDQSPEQFGYLSFGFEVIDNQPEEQNLLKNLITYTLNDDCNCFIPFSKLTFVYDQTGRLYSMDTYVFEANAYHHNWRQLFEYFPSDKYYRNNLYLVDDSGNSELHSFKEIHYGTDLMNVLQVKFFWIQYETTMEGGEHKYSYSENGLTVSYINNGLTSKIEYLIEDGNPVKSTHYDVNGNITGEAEFTYDSKPNPFRRIFPNIIMSESQNNLLMKTAGQYVEQYLYKFDQYGRVKESMRSVSNSIDRKVVFEYY